jgi:sorbitol-specific phosphotransferase system component IIC
MNRVKPSRQRSAGLVKDRAGRWMKVMAAMVAGVRPASRRLMVLSNALAHFAKDTVRVQAIAEPLEAGPVVRKHLLKVLNLEILEYETFHPKDIVF